MCERGLRLTRDDVDGGVEVTAVVCTERCGGMKRCAGWNGQAMVASVRICPRSGPHHRCGGGEDWTYVDELEESGHHG